MDPKHIGVTTSTYQGHVTSRGALDTDLDPAGSEVRSGEYWPELHNYYIKHHNIFFIPGNDA